MGGTHGLRDSCKWGWCVTADGSHCPAGAVARQISTRWAMFPDPEKMSHPDPGSGSFIFSQMAMNLGFLNKSIEILRRCGDVGHERVVHLESLLDPIHGFIGLIRHKIPECHIPKADGLAFSVFLQTLHDLFIRRDDPRFAVDPLDVLKASSSRGNGRTYRTARRTLSYCLTCKRRSRSSD